MRLKDWSEILKKVNLARLRGKHWGGERISGEFYTLNSAIGARVTFLIFVISHNLISLFALDARIPVVDA